MAAAVQAAVRTYLAVAVVCAASDEGDAWTLRALPSTGKSKHWRRLFTLNVSNMEVLYPADRLRACG